MLDEVDAEFQRSRNSNLYSNFGPTSLSFERRIEDLYFPDEAVVAGANCTVCLTGVLIGMRVAGPVVVPAFTFPATLSAVRSAGLPVVLGDVDERTGVLDPDSAETLIKAHGCKALIAVRPYGIWSDISDLAEVCRRHDVLLIVDNAAGLGVERSVVERFRAPGSFEAFSLHATKPFGIGEGGLVVVPPDERHNVRSALNFGLWSLGDLQPGEGINGKMDELAAAMAVAVLKHFPERLVERQGVAAKFNGLARQLGLETFVAPGEEINSPWQCFAIRLPEDLPADAVVRNCVAEGLQLRRYYYPPLAMSSVPADVPHTVRLSARTVCLPVYDGADADSASEVWEIFSRALSMA